MGGYRATDPAQCREAYERMQKDGSLSKCEAEIVSALLAETTPRTAGELAKAMAHAGPNHANRNNVATRLSELCRRNVVQSGITRVCTVTGAAVYEWSLTGMPAGPKVKRTPSKAAQLEALLVKMALALTETAGLSTKECEQWSARISERIAEIKQG